MIALRDRGTARNSLALNKTGRPTSKKKNCAGPPPLRRDVSSYPHTDSSSSEGRDRPSSIAEALPLVSVYDHMRLGGQHNNNRKKRVK